MISTTVSAPGVAVVWGTRVTGTAGEPLTVTLDSPTRLGPFLSVCDVRLRGHLVGKLWRGIGGWHAFPTAAGPGAARHRSAALALAAWGWREGITAAGLLSAPQFGRGVRLTAGGLALTVVRAELDHFTPYSGDRVRVWVDVTDAAGEVFAHGPHPGVCHPDQVRAVRAACGALEARFAARNGRYEVQLLGSQAFAYAGAEGR